MSSSPVAICRVDLLRAATAAHSRALVNAVLVASACDIEALLTLVHGNSVTARQLMHLCNIIAVVGWAVTPAIVRRLTSHALLPGQLEMLKQGRPPEV